MSSSRCCARSLVLQLITLLTLLSAPGWAAWTPDPQGCDGGNKTLSASANCNLNGEIEAGHVLVIAAGADNVAASDGATTLCSGVIDSQSNTYHKLCEFTNAQGEAEAGATVCAFYSILTTGLTLGAGDSITMNFSSSTPVKWTDGQEFTIASGSTVSLEGSCQTRADDNADAGPVSISGLTSAEYLFFRATASETNECSPLTISSGYDETHAACSSGGNEKRNMGVSWEFDIATGTASTSDPLMNDTSADRASIFMALKENVQ